MDPSISPLAKSRLETREDGTVVIRLKQPWADGTGAIQLSRLELMERLAALVPPPRKNQVLYHGVLASRAAWRASLEGLEVSVTLLVLHRVRPLVDDAVLSL